MIWDLNLRIMESFSHINWNMVDSHVEWITIQFNFLFIYFFNEKTCSDIFYSVSTSIRFLVFIYLLPLIVELIKTSQE